MGNSKWLASDKWVITVISEIEGRLRELCCKSIRIDSNAKRTRRIEHKDVKCCRRHRKPALILEKWAYACPLDKNSTVIRDIMIFVSFERYQWVDSEAKI